MKKFFPLAGALGTVEWSLSSSVAPSGWVRTPASRTKLAAGVSAKAISMVGLQFTKCWSRRGAFCWGWPGFHLPQTSGVKKTWAARPGERARNQTKLLLASGLRRAGPALEAAPINPDDEDELKREPRPEQPRRNRTHAMQGGVEVRGEDGHEEGNQAPARQLPRRGQQHAETAQDFCDATDVDQGQRPRQRRKVRVRGKVMVANE